jgi:hypothetical protein
VIRELRQSASEGVAGGLSDSVLGEPIVEFFLGLGDFGGSDLRIEVRSYVANEIHHEVGIFLNIVRKFSSSPGGVWSKRCPATPKKPVRESCRARDSGPVPIRMSNWIEI